MAQKLTGKVAEEYAAKYPNTKTHTLARMLYDENRALYNSVEHARSTIRRIRGALGKQNRSRVKAVPELRRPHGSGHDTFPPIPKPRTHFDTHDAAELSGSKFLILSDIHSPYHDAKALEAALQYGRENKANHIVLNGDTFDCYSQSFWQTDPRKRDLAGEIHEGRELLAAIRARFPRAKITFKMGNHEERWDRYLQVKAPELLGVEEFAYENIMQLDAHRMDFVTNKRVCKVGDLAVIHGHEYRFNISNPVNPARGFFLRAKASILAGHLHQQSHHTERTINEEFIGAWSTGCLCQLEVEYDPLGAKTKWSHGFAFVTVQKSGRFNVRNLGISDRGVEDGGITG